MKACPRCDAEIGDTAVACSCGWRDRKPKGEPMERRCDCCYAGCPNDAILKIRMPTGWANVCDNHYRIVTHLQAERYCNDLGLDTLDKRKAHLRELLKRFGRRIALPALREPGQDDEERVA